MKKKEVIWIFGFDAVGKKTLMINTALGKSKVIQKALNLDKHTIFIPLVVGKRNRRQRLQNLFTLYDTDDITKELCNVVYLIHGQWADFNCSGRNLEYFYDIYPEAFNRCLFLTTTPEKREERMRLRGMESTNGDNLEVYNENLTKYFNEIFIQEI
jgi:hypothetical protein